MAKIVETPQKFKVIHVTRVEMQEHIVGTRGICDSCGKAKIEGYLICVLSQWYCPSCYTDFIKRAKRHPEDIHIEEIRFARYRKLFNI